MASFLSASKTQEERCPVPEEKEEMVGLTVSVSQGDRSSSPAENKKTEQLMELRKSSASKPGGDGSGDDEVGNNSITTPHEGDNSQPSEDEPEPKTATTSGKKPKYQYTREQLIELRNHPLSRQKPSIPNNDALPFHRSRSWDQDQWHHGPRHENSIEDDRGGRGDGPHDSHKRHTGDPRERIRKEQDGIVLSPQRRNFNSGCFVVAIPQSLQKRSRQQQSSQHQQGGSNRRPESPLGKGEREGHREITSNRRIGSGRIINRERDREYWVDFRAECEKELDGDFGGFRGMRDRDRDERSMRSERRPFGRDFDRDRDGFGGSGNGGSGDRGSIPNKGSERNSGRSGHYGNDRRRSYGDCRGEEEPEWFSGGPTSQHDTIELRGFEDIPEDSVVSNSGQSSQRTKKQALNSKTGQKSNVTKTVLASKKSPHSSGKTSPSLPSLSEAPALPADKERIEKDAVRSPKNSKPSSPVSSLPNKASLNQNQDGAPTASTGDFNYEEFLKMDSIQGLLTNGASTEGPFTGGSRFSQWFRRDSPPPNVAAAAMFMASSQQNQLVTEGGNLSGDIGTNKVPGANAMPLSESRRSSLQDELLNNIINEITEPNIVIPSLGGPDSYFAPISPAASTTIGGGIRGQDQDTSSSKSSLLLEMLNRGSNQQRSHRQSQQPDGLAPGMMKPPSIKELEVSGKLHSVEELEARLRQSSAVGSGGRSSVAPGGGRVRHKGDGADLVTSGSGQSEEDIAAFKKLLAQVSGGQATPASNGVGQHFGILQMLGNKDNNSQQSSGLAHQPGVTSSGAPTPNDPGILGGLLGRSGGLPPSPAQLSSGAAAPRPSPLQQSMVSPDLVMRLLQVQQQQHHQQQLQRQQQEWLSKLAGAQNQQLTQQPPMAHMQPPPHHTHIPHLHHGAPQGMSQRVQGQLGPLSSIPNLPTSPTPSTSLSPLPPELQMVINQTQSGRDLLQRTETQNIIRGMSTAPPPSHQAPMSSQQQQVAAAVAVVAATAAAASASPRATSPHTDFIHQILLQQQQQQQMRIPSPLNNAYCQQPRVLSPSTSVHLATASGPANNTNQPMVTSPIAPNQSNTLAIQHAAGMAPHRVPSPRELRAHTQQIMHAALIKKKLEEQKENYRRRQEMQQQSHSPNPGTGGNKVESSTPPAKHSPTPLAFTPTSVLRKMTAEKDPLTSSDSLSIMSNPIGKADLKIQGSVDNKSQQSQILAMSSLGQLQPSNQWKNESHAKTQQGRAIVKGGGGNSMNTQYGSVMDYQSQKMSHLLENHSQTQVSSNLMQNAGHGSHGGQYPVVGNRGSKSTTRTVGMNSGGGAGMSSNAVPPQFMKQPVMLMRPTGVNAAAAARVQSLHTQMAGMQNRGSGGNGGSRMGSGGFSIPHGLSPSLQQLLLSQNSYVGMGGNIGGPGGVDRMQHQTSLGVKSGISSGRPGSTSVSAQSTSPTNQLDRWFSQELLARARAGKLPDMPPVSTQRALSLEEVERLQQAATSVRN